MQKESSRLVKLGILVAGAIGLFIAAIFFISSKQYVFTDTFSLNVRFNDANGLNRGDYVRYAGVKVGTVSRVAFENDTTVRVEMNIEESKRPYIRGNAVASIASDGLVGNKIISIKPGKSAPMRADIVEKGDFIQGKNPIDTDEVLDKLEVLNDDAVKLFGKLTLLVENLTLGKGLMPVLLTDTTLAKDLQDIISATKESSEKLSENMDALQHNWLLRGYFKKKRKASE